MDPKNIKLYERNGLFFIKDQNKKDIYFEYKDVYNYYDINVNKISLFKQSDNEYFIKYGELNKMSIAPLQLKINNFYGELHTFTNNYRVLYIESDNKEFF